MKRAFHHFDHKALNKKILELWKAPDESFLQFWECFHNLTFQFLEDEIDWKFLRERFHYLLHISENPQVLESFKPLPTYLSVRDAKSKMDKVIVTSDCPSSSHQTALALQCEVGEGAHPSVELSHPPTPLALEFYVDLACKTFGCHVDLFPQPLSPRSVDPPDYIVLCSPVLESTLVVHEDQVIDGIVLSIQPALSFIMSMFRNLKKNSRWRMTSFYLHLTHFFLTSLVVLPLLIFLVRIHF